MLPLITHIDCIFFYTQMPTADVARILSLAEGICRSLNVDEVDADTSITALIDLAVQEMTHSNELIADWQLPASQLLVAIGRTFCDKVWHAKKTQCEIQMVKN